MKNLTLAGEGRRSATRLRAMLRGEPAAGRRCRPAIPHPQVRRARGHSRRVQDPLPCLDHLGSACQCAGPARRGLSPGRAPGQPRGRRPQTRGRWPAESTRTRTRTAARRLCINSESPAPPASVSVSDSGWPGRAAGPHRQWRGSTSECGWLGGAVTRQRPPPEPESLAG
jgi:hypothetical protein